MTEFDLLSAAAGGMDAQRAVMDVAARNVAAAQASTPGHPYARLVARLTTEGGDGDEGTPGVLHFAGVRTERGTGDALTELIAVLDAQRSFEADASLFDVGKRLAERTLDLERG